MKGKVEYNESYLAEWALAEHLEQLKVSRADGLSFLLRHITDVDLLFHNIIVILK